jgi:hypothetical protein
MSLKKFGQNDIILNTMLAYPQNEFFIYNASVYYNNVPSQAGTATATSKDSSSPVHFTAVSQVRMVAPGAISLYEYNIDRPDTGDLVGALAIAEDKTGSSGLIEPVTYAAAQARLTSGEPVTFVKDNNRIYPWISKDSAGSSWKTVSATDYATEYQYGSILTGEYPLSASIVRELITNPSSSYNKHYFSLRNRLDFYGVRNIHYKISASVGSQSWNKDIQELNTIAIPSIFFGSRIKPGTVSLKYYWTGSLLGELQDIRQNGELVQVSASKGEGITYKNTTAGVIMYDEGYIILTGSWDLSIETDADGERPTWLNYAKGANDSQSPGTNVSFALNFQGRTETQVMTLFTHAKRGEANFSNNPTYLQYGQDKLQFTSSHVYEENSEQLVANTVSSSYSSYNADFKRSVYISRIAVYDENKNIIGIATLANPVLKEEDQDYSIKLKLDI